MLSHLCNWCKNKWLLYLCLFPSPLPLQPLRKQIMKNNRYKWLLHQTTWWMQPELPASHPFLFSLILSHSTFSPLLCFHQLYISVWKWDALSPNHLIIVWLHHLSSLLGTNTIFTLTSYWARFFFHSFILLSLSPPPHPAVVSTGTLFSPFPRSFLYTATAKQTPGTL